MEFGIIGLVVLVLDIIAILSIIQSGLDPVMKVVWVLVVLLLPVIGMILWFLIGSKKLA
ncbi:PLDc N-terminal domain-containing protein [Phycisphaeraceae bacterium D3-23]